MFHDLRKLQHFVEVARRGNYAAAAQSLGVAQPTLTRSVQGLERQVGGRLLDRGRNGAVPTALGAELLTRATILLRDAKEAERELQLRAGVGAGHLHIGAGTYPADISIGLATARFIGMYPAISVDIAIADWSAQLENLLEGSIDFVVAEASGVLDDDRVHVELLPRHDGRLFCRTGHPLLEHGDTLSQADLSAYPYVSTSLPPRMERAFASGQLHPAFVQRHRVDTFELIRRIVLESDALGAGTPAQLAADLEAGRVALLPVTLPELHTAYGILSLAQRSMSPAATAFVRVLREVEAEIAERGERLAASPA